MAGKINVRPHCQTKWEYTADRWREVTGIVRIKTGQVICPKCQEKNKKRK